jgi:hypothetical protein
MEIHEVLQLGKPGDGLPDKVQPRQWGQGFMELTKDKLNRFHTGPTMWTISIYIIQLQSGS